jgi:hypothetical protein
MAEDHAEDVVEVAGPAGQAADRLHLLDLPEPPELTAGGDVATAATSVPASVAAG